MADRTRVWAGQLTAAEVLAHPEYPHVFWNLTPSSEGKIKAGKGRGGPYSISYEVHGTGATHVLFVSGLGGLKSTWQRQVKDLGHLQAEKYTVLVADNIGMGRSDKPLLKYSTSNMAKDLVEVLDHVGWTQPRSVHVCGISMGGMISQELAMVIPERLASLTLLSTAARIVNTVGFLENLQNRVNMFTPKSPDQQINRGKWSMYSKEFLESKDELEYTVKPFPTAGDRFAAGELRKRTDHSQFTRKGFTLQALAAGWHSKSPAQLKKIAETVGRERITVIHGTVDNMISFPHSDTLYEELNAGAAEGAPKVRRETFEGVGHVIPTERRAAFKDLIEDIISKASS